MGRREELSALRLPLYVHASALQDEHRVKIDKYGDTFTIYGPKQVQTRASSMRAAMCLALGLDGRGQVYSKTMQSVRGGHA